MRRTLFAIAIGFLILGGLLLGAQSILKKNLFPLLFQKYAWIPLVLIGASALWIGFTRDTYLPFLGETVMPCSILKDSIPEDATHYAKVKVVPGAKILFWAAEPENEDLDALKDWRQAYLGFKNAGVVTAGVDGIAVLRFRDPQPYKVPLAGALKSHVHYRTCVNQGLLGRVETIGTVQSQMEEAKTQEDSNIYPAIESFLDKVEKETKELLQPVVETVPTTVEPPKMPPPEGVPLSTTSGPERLLETETFIDYAPATFVGEEGPRQMTDDNTLYYLAAQTEKNRLALSSMGVDESPQPAGSDYSTAFSYKVSQ